MVRDIRLRVRLGAVIAAGVVAGVIVGACAGHALTRGRAERLIRRSEEVTMLGKGFIVRHQGAEEGVRRGLFRWGPPQFVFRRAVLAEEARRRYSGLEPVNPISGDYFLVAKVPPGPPEVEVTGIRGPTDEERLDYDWREDDAVAEFRWQLRRYPKELAGIAVVEGTGKGFFRRYDDGWRLLTLKLDL